MRFRLVVLLACLALLVPVGLALVRDEPVPAERASLAAAASKHTQWQFASSPQFATGYLNGVTNSNGWLRFGSSKAIVRIGGGNYEMASWNSPLVRPGHSFTELVPSWKATANANSWVVIRVRVRDTQGRFSGWKRMAQWHQTLGRTTSGPQADAIASVATDTLVARPGVQLDGYQVRVELLRKRGGQAIPALSSVHAVASRIGAVPATSRPLRGAQSLDVPAYSQMVHRGEYPQYGGGGQAWCSPTSLSMVLAYFGARPTPAEYGWVNRRYPDRWVDHTAREVFDSGYDGAGNWAFNTAYAATRLPEAMVTRLVNLRHVENFIARGIPVIVSISFARGQLSGTPIGSTNGHLVVITGFTASGDVRVNDPAAPSNAGVRRVYDRAQFERAWLGKSHGTAYLVRGAGKAFPPGYTGW